MVALITVEPSPHYHGSCGERDRRPYRVRIVQMNVDRAAGARSGGTGPCVREQPGGVDGRIDRIDPVKAALVLFAPETRGTPYPLLCNLAKIKG